MSTIQQRFEVDQPVLSVYEAIAQPQDVLQRLPGVARVTRVSDDLYRVLIGAAEGTREIDVQLTRSDDLRRVEWRTTDGVCYGAITAESIGPARTAVGVHAECTGPENVVPSPSTVHDTLQAFKRALQSVEVHISRRDSAYSSAYGYDYARDDSTRRFASDWRNAARSASEYPFALVRTLTQQMDRVWEQMWRGTPIARLPQMMPGMAWHPNVEVCERDDQVRVCIDVPGIDEAHLQVEIHGGHLTVRGERQDDRGDDGGRRRTELHYGSFTRRVPLPDGIDADAAKAILRNGVLEVRIPLHRREARRVPVQSVG